MLEAELLQHVFAPLTAALNSRMSYPIPLVPLPPGSNGTTTPHYNSGGNATPKNGGTISNSNTTTPHNNSGSATIRTPGSATTPGREGGGIELSDSLIDMLHEEVREGTRLILILLLILTLSMTPTNTDIINTDLS